MTHMTSVRASQPSQRTNLDSKFSVMRRLLALAFALTCIASAQNAPGRTIEEIKTEAIRRAENGIYPLIGLDPNDVREAFASITTRDKDEWAAAFIAVGDRYMAEANAVAATDPIKANSDYVRAWRLYSFGRWPVPSSPGKQRAYSKAIEAFLPCMRCRQRFPSSIGRCPGSEPISCFRLCHPRAARRNPGTQSSWESACARPSNPAGLGKSECDTADCRT